MESKKIEVTIKWPNGIEQRIQLLTRDYETAKAAWAQLPYTIEIINLRLI